MGERKNSWIAQLSLSSHVKIEVDKAARKRNLILINKIDFVAKNLTSNAGIFLLLENTKANGIFELIDTDLVFDNKSTNKFKRNHIKTMLCGHFIGIEKLERLKLLQGDHWLTSLIFQWKNLKRYPDF